MKSVNPECTQEMVTRKEKTLKVLRCGEQVKYIPFVLSFIFSPKPEPPYSCGTLPPPSVSLGSALLFDLQCPRLSPGALCVFPDSAADPFLQNCSLQPPHGSEDELSKMYICWCYSLLEILNEYPLIERLTQAPHYSLGLSPTIPFTSSFGSGQATNLAGPSICHPLSHLHTSAHLPGELGQELNFS